MYYNDGRLVVAVTDSAAARTVREAGGGTKMVTRSKAELESVHRKLDQLGNIPNTAWGIQTNTNQVSVEIFDGAPADARARIEQVAAAHQGAVRIERINSTLSFKATDLRGGNGINECSAGFNTKSSSGAIYTLTAGHCDYSEDWRMAYNGAKIGYTAYRAFGGDYGDQQTIRANAAGINPLGTVRYWGGIYKQIDEAQWPNVGWDIDRIGVSSQDKTGSVTAENVTVNMSGTTVHGLFRSDVCALPGDSGGPALRSTTALGLLSGGTGEQTCTSSSSGTYRNYFMPVKKVLNDRGLRVY
ncbi:S1 family peptidase [Streptomyces boninensis]|uniref:S1 family peptidase n=1 Tax=Streptomyces boninensis TaxID=2039455 RepID=UPI003B21EFD6